MKIAVRANGPTYYAILRYAPPEWRWRYPLSIDGRIADDQFELDVT